MPRFIALVMCGLLLGPLGVYAQLTVQLSLERETYLLYESMPVVVTIRNFSGRPVKLEAEGGRSWLRFSITNPSMSLVPATDRQVAEETLTIEPGQTVKRRIDLVPLYELRATGAFRAQAVVESVGIRAASMPQRFEIVGGREIWTRTCGLPPSGPGADEYRTYSAIIKREGQYDVLYVSVRAEAQNLVYGVMPLGTYVSVGSPEGKTDKAGNLYFLFRSGPRSFNFAKVDPAGKVLDRAVYSNVLSEPKLVVSDTGEVVVHGGEMTYPRDERPVIQPLPVPEPPKKKKWWWPFGPAEQKPGQPKSEKGTPDKNEPTSNVKSR